MVTALEKEEILAKQWKRFDLFHFDYVLTVEAAKFLKSGLFYRFISFIILPLFAVLETLTNIIFTGLALLIYFLGYAMLLVPFPLVWVLSPELFKTYKLYFQSLYPPDSETTGTIFALWISGIIFTTIFVGVWSLVWFTW